jgi:exo-beta-1,3-glucanase (GH17 family)
MNGLENVPQLAAQHDLNVTIGAWINSDPIASQQEVDKLISISRMLIFFIIAFLCYL